MAARAADFAFVFVFGYDDVNPKWSGVVGATLSAMASNRRTSPRKRP